MCRVVVLLEDLQVLSTLKCDHLRLHDLQVMVMLEKFTRLTSSIDQNKLQQVKDWDLKDDNLVTWDHVTKKWLVRQG